MNTVISQTKSLVNFCTNNKIPTISFPKGLKNNYTKFIEIVKPTAINIDPEVDPMWAKKI